MISSSRRPPIIQISSSKATASNAWFGKGKGGPSDQVFVAGS